METFTRKQLIDFAAFAISKGCDSDRDHLRDMFRRWQAETKRESAPPKRLKGYVIVFSVRGPYESRYWTGTGLSSQIKDAWMYPPETNMRSEIDHVRRLAIVADLSLPQVMEILA